MILQFMNHYTEDGIPVLRSVDKDDVLRQFYTQRDDDSTYQGYDSWDESVVSGFSNIVLDPVLLVPEKKKH